jgi:AcrR family transcriptional regulator
LVQAVESTPRASDRGVARRQAFLKAARVVFLEQGYEAACVNDIVRIAGGSLATLYSQFANKEGLFFAVAQDQHERIIAAMTPPSVGHLSLEEGLQAIGERFLKALLDPENVAFFHIVVSEGRKFPQLLQRYSAASADRVRDVVAQHIRAAAPDLENADQIAGYLLDLLRSRHLYRSLADQTYVLTDEQVAQHVAAAVRFLVRGART